MPPGNLKPNLTDGKNKKEEGSKTKTKLVMTEGQPFPNSGENNYRDTDGGKLYT